MDHEAYLAACMYILTERVDIGVNMEIANIIRADDAGGGGVNDDTQE